MIRTDEIQQPSIVPVAEVERRLAEYRRQGSEHQAMPHGVYLSPFIVCPWTGCGFRFSARDYQIEKSADPALYSRVLSAWWQGPGVVGRCPGCANFVLFNMTHKQTVTDPATQGMTLLPDDWHQQAYIVS
jgi:hypothetical protein